MTYQNINPVLYAECALDNVQDMDGTAVIQSGLSCGNIVVTSTKEGCNKEIIGTS